LHGVAAAFNVRIILEEHYAAASQFAWPNPIFPVESPETASGFPSLKGDQFVSF
jgi:hypothetical protein